MTLDEAIANLENPNVHELTLSNSELTKWLKELRKAREFLRETLPVLKTAFFANYKDTNAANELYDKIKAVVGGEY